MSQGGLKYLEKLRIILQRSDIFIPNSANDF